MGIRNSLRSNNIVFFLKLLQVSVGHGAPAKRILVPGSLLYSAKSRCRCLCEPQKHLHNRTTSYQVCGYSFIVQIIPSCCIYF